MLWILNCEFLDGSLHFAREASVYHPIPSPISEVAILPGEGRGDRKHSTCLECGFLPFHKLYVCSGGLVWGLTNIKWKLTYLLSP